MKKIILILILQLFIFNQIFAKEINTRLGYSIKLSKEYTLATKENLNKLIADFNNKKMKDVLGNEYSQGFFSQLQCNPLNEFSKQECIFLPKFNPQYNSIMLMIMGDGSKLPPNNAANLHAGCTVKHKIFIPFLELMQGNSELFNNNIEQHDCYYTDILKPKFKESLYSVHDGFLKDQLLFEYTYQVSSGMGSTLVMCLPKNCLELVKESIKITKSIN